MYRITTATDRGGRDYQEDRFLALKLNNGRHFFAVMDGHGGAEVAEYCRARIPELADRFSSLEGIKLPEATANQIAYESRNYEAGSTLSLAVVDGDVAHVAVIGDSPVIVASPTGYWLGPSHSVCDNPSEARRVMDTMPGAGGEFDGRIYSADGRRSMQLTRSLGDRREDDILFRYAECATRILRPNTAVVLCTDGMIRPEHEYANWHEEIAAMASDGCSAQEILARRKRFGLEDNATIVVCQPF